jgi:hypothetical protein
MKMRMVNIKMNVLIERKIKTMYDRLLLKLILAFGLAMYALWHSNQVLPI